MSKIFRSTFALLVASLLVAAGAAPALAQESGSSEKPAYAQKYQAGLQTAKQAQSLAETNPKQAAATYAEAYQTLNEAAKMAEEAGATGNARKIRQMVAKVAYQAGQLLYKNDMPEAAVKHFQYGLDVYPSFAKNRQGLSAAQSAMQQGPIVAASQAIRDGEPTRALELLSQAEPTADVYFYQAAAYQMLNDSESAIAAANRALEAGGLSATRRGRLYLIRGEAQIKLGQTGAACSSLASAQAQGGPQTSARAKALIEQVGECTAE